MSVEEFLTWERREELRYEFDGVQPVAMTGGTVAHSVIATNIVPEPVIVFEVSSASTALLDRNIKAAEYPATPSVQRYVILEQTRADATVHSRDGADWIESRLTGTAAILPLPEVAIEVPLAELYHRVRFGS